MNQTQASNKSRKQQLVFLLVLIGLLILRIPFMAGMEFFQIQWAWTGTIFIIGTYLLTTFLIWWEIDNLAEYNIDTFAVIIVALFTPICTLISLYTSGHQTPLVFILLISLIATTFSVGMWLGRSKLPAMKRIHFIWLVLGILAGVATSFILSLPRTLTASSYDASRWLSIKSILMSIPLQFIYQIGTAAVLEEPLFRGFLWGYLRNSRWHEIWIWLFQAALFTLGHIYYIHTSPISFWIIVPVDSLVLGWLVWRSKTISSSLTAHGMLNATIRFVI